MMAVRKGSCSSCQHPPCCADSQTIHREQAVYVQAGVAVHEGRQNRGGGAAAITHHCHS